MKKQEELSVFWVHVIVTVLVTLFMPPLGAVYLCGIAVYYTGKAVVRILKNGRPGARLRSPQERSEFSYNIVIRLVWSVGLSLITMVPFAVYVEYDSPNTRRETDYIGLAVAAIGSTIVMTPVWFVILLVLSIPFRIWRWMNAQREKHQITLSNQEYRRQQEILGQQERENKIQQRAQQTRRVEARAQCELAYSLVAPEIAQRFPKSAMDAFIATYMNDAFDPSDVERRGKELQKIIEQHRTHVKPDKKPRTIQELAEWYLAEKERIETLPLDEEIKDEHLAVLNERYAELSQNVLQKSEP